ncbi:hypothetical protein GQ53DRAFT_749454 [Thozetella sp. PMI_491]|nr:hypothetical protein GQ53DRAFT_749454 [Thozetella sp. PMI_491]
MTSSDVRDVLNLPSVHAGPRPSKKQKTSASRPNLKGLAREVQYLGGDNPIAIVPEVSFFKKRRLANKPAAKWELRPFANSARGDDGALLLRHWRRKTTDGDAMQVDSEPRPEDDNIENQESPEKLEDSAFSKYNVKVDVPQYTEAQYNSNLESDDWTKEETDYLLDLAREYDLRWALIWDRYDFAPEGSEGEGGNGTSTAVIPAPKQRSMEDLKARYYGVAARMMIAQTPAQHMNRQEFELYETMLHFNPAQERTRKEFAVSTMARSKEEAREEESLLLEVRRLLARSQRFNEERRELYNRLDYPHTETDINAFKSSNGLNTLLQNLMNIDKSKKRKSLVGPESAATATATATAPGSAVSEGHNRRESIAASVSHRDSIVGTPATPAEPTPTSKKKGAQPPERRKLTELEEKTYGVSHHDRLGSGPTFRYEKINKLYSHKSGQQQMRMTNALSELDVPSRLAMPTAAVVTQFEVLWAAVANLVDLRKTSDKLEAEIKVEEARKATRVEKQPAAEKADASEATGTEKGPDAAVVPGESKVEASKQGPAEEKTQAEGSDGSEMQPPAVDGEKSAPSPVAIKEEEGEKDKVVRPGSSGAHKRSASVLSVTSDKSAKRQKK